MSTRGHAPPSRRAVDFVLPVDEIASAIALLCTPAEPRAAPDATAPHPSGA